MLAFLVVRVFDETTVGGGAWEQGYDVLQATKVGRRPGNEATNVIHTDTPRYITVRVH